MQNCYYGRMNSVVPNKILVYYMLEEAIICQTDIRLQKEANKKAQEVRERAKANGKCQRNPYMRDAITTPSVDEC